MAPLRKELSQRYTKAATTRTCSFHEFIRLSESLIGANRVSRDEEFAIIFNLVLGEPINSENQPMIHVKPSNFLFTVRMIFFWIGLADTIDEEHMDIEVKVMHPHYPARSFFWTKKENK